jgi:hypothetical protein
MSEYIKKDGTKSTYNYNKLNKIDDLCNKVNEKYKIHSRYIGSIERYTDMCTNKLVQIANDCGGYIDLIYGTEKQLEQYLRNILDNKISLNVMI